MKSEAAPAKHKDLRSAIEGCLLGMAVGDALGLPYEGLAPRRAARLFGAPDRHRFFLGRGMISDDTEHACMTAQAFIAAGADPDRFARNLAWRLRGWLMGLPAGVGYGTLRAILKLCVGVPPARSGVRSAGNGPCMRAPVLGVSCAGDPERMRALVRVSTRLTHRDDRAEHAAQAAALATACAAQGLGPDAFVGRLRIHLGGAPGAGELTDRIARSVQDGLRGLSPAEHALAMGWGNGIGGYAYVTVPAVMHAWAWSRGDFRAGVSGLIACGGDADTTAAILGGILGAGAGRAGIPQAWLSCLSDWPRSTAWVGSLAGRLAESVAEARPGRPVPLAWPLIPARNLLFALLVLGHGFRRLLPPY